MDSMQLEQLAAVLESCSIEGLQVFWSENVFRGTITVNGVDVSLERATVDVSGSSESSNFVHDDSGNLVHYHGETLVTSGTVDALYAGLGGHVPGITELGASVDFKVAAQNNFTSDQKTHDVYRSEGKVVDSTTEVHTIDHSTEVLGAKVGGTTESAFTSKTVETEQSESWFLARTDRKTTEEHVHTKSEHGIISDEVTILKEEVIVSEELLEAHLTAAGYGCLVIVVKPVMTVLKTVQAKGSITPEEVLKSIVQTAAGVGTLAHLTRCFSTPSIGMAVMVVAQNAVPLVQGEYDLVQKNMGVMLKSILVVQGTSWTTRALLMTTPMAPWSSIVSAGAGVAAGSMVADIDFSKLHAAFLREWSRHRIKLLE
ncbi:unnamed protein product [Symbiodinium natans]|uniref:Uncharacterized protein n=1 Tax=Symbiodinium natans TaxID=878477 RepID=A0A812NCP0_9DINO|nr:unnamed protein product [Symbiodinium natans]